MKQAAATAAASQDAAAAQQRMSPHFGGAATDNSARGEKTMDNVEAEQPPREGGQESVVVERRGEFAAVCKWSISQFARVKARSLWSKYFEVGGYDCRLLVYPRGDTQALPGYLSIYLQVTDPRASKWDCFASYKLSVVNQRDESKSIQRDSWHRFSVKKKSHGWCDFTASSTVLDSRSGFLVNESVLITTEILILNETVSFTRELELSQASDILSGKFTWKVQNFSLFKEMIKTQKIMSPVFPAGECNLRLSVYQSSVNGVEHLSMCLESKEIDKSSNPQDRSCWCLFRMSVLNQKPGSGHMHRDSYGRFAGDNKSGDNTSLGWNDYMKMADFLAPETGHLVDDTAIFSASFHVIKEVSTFSRSTVGGRANRRSDGYQGKFSWKIESFTKLKELLKKRKITGLCIKSRRFQVGNRDCRLIVYPRGQSQPPCHLSMFLEMTDPRSTTSDWSCFVSHRLSVVNRIEERSVTKESQNRYCKAAKDWGWREFITLTNLFDQDSGFLVQDAVTFSAEVLILKEISSISDKDSDAAEMNRATFTWKVENFLSFKEIMETRKIFSKFFQAGGCELRIGVYESFDTLCIYLESDQSASSDPDRNFWVRYRMAVLNQKHAEKTVWKESSICTKTWNNSVLQCMKVSDMVEPDAGFLVRDTIVFVCDILDCCPWFEFNDLEVLVSDDEQDGLSTDPEELLDTEDSEENSVDEEDLFRSLLSRAGFHFSYGENPQLLLDPSQLQLNLREKLLMDAGAVAAFLTGLRVYVDDPAKVKRLLLPTKVSTVVGKQGLGKAEALSPSLMNLFMGVKALQPDIVDLLLDIMVGCCRPADAKSRNGDATSISKAEIGGVTTRVNPAESILIQRLDDAGDKPGCTVQSTMLDTKTVAHASPAPVHPDPSYDRATEPLGLREQSEELLGLIVNTLRTLDTAVPIRPEPKRRPESAKKMALVIGECPKHLRSELVALVPKLVDTSEHGFAANSLLDWLKSDMQLPVLNAIRQLAVDSQVWDRVLQYSLRLLPDCSDETLAAAVACIFKASTESKQSVRGVKAVRGKLKRLGPTVSPRVLDVVRETVRSCPETAEALLRDIDSDFEVSEGDGPTGSSGLQQQAAAQRLATMACYRVADVDILVEMLRVPSLVVEAQHVFERCVARGAFGEQAVTIVLEKRRSQRLIVDYRTGNAAGQVDAVSPEQDNDFPAVLGLAETLSCSKDARVLDFVSTVYPIMFKVYGDGGYRERMLSELVQRAISSNRAANEAQLGMDILTVLVREEEATAQPVLNMMRKAVERANAERDALRQQLRSSAEELNKVRSEKQNEANRLAKEKASLSQRLMEAEACQTRLKQDMKMEAERALREKKEIADRMRDVEAQLEWALAEREDELSKLNSEKRAVQDKLRDAERVKNSKRDELKRAVKERSALAERLKASEAARKKEEGEHRMESASWNEERQALLETVRRMDRAAAEMRDDIRSKEEQLQRYANEIYELREKLQASEEDARQARSCYDEELRKHAPLYGAYLDALSISELNTVAKIHEDGLKAVNAELNKQRSRCIVDPRLLVAAAPPQMNGFNNNNNNSNNSNSWYYHHQ